MFNKDPINEMILALDENINYLKQVGNSQIKITNGNLIKNIEDVYIYEFELEFLQYIDEDADIDLRVKGESSNGRVISVSEKIIRVSIDKYLGNTIHEAHLIISSYYLLELLREKLNYVHNGDQKLTNLSEKTFNLLPSRKGIADYVIPHSSITQLPNKSQENAIKLALGSEVSYIWGPPGTGKTQTIARIIEGFLTKNLSVLLIAHTNIATDGALLYLVEHLRSSDDYLEGKFLREGAISKTELKKYDLVDPVKVIENKGKPIKIEIQRLKNEIENNNEKIIKQEEIINKFQKLKKIINEVENVRGDISNKEHIIISSTARFKEIISKINDIDENIQNYQSKGRLGKFFSGLNLDKLLSEKSTYLINKKKEQDRISVNKKVVEEGKLKLDKYIEEKNKLENDLNGENLDGCLKFIDQIKNKTKDLEEQRTSLTKQLEELLNSIYKEAKVIATTLTKSYSSKIILNREYDSIIIDEASMAPLPALWYAAGLAKQKVVIVGDFLQLPPIVKYRASKNRGETEEDLKAKEKLVNDWLKSNIFETSGIVDSISSGTKPDCLEQLKVQYRMHPDMANVINSLVYGKNGKEFELDSAPNTYNNGLELLSKEPLSNAHIGLYDTSEIGTIPTKTDSGSYYNLYQALLAVNLAKAAIKNGYEDIGIISPFRAQANLIKKILEDEELNYKVEADTVHRFQGDEKQIIIFDTTTPQPTQLTDDQKEGGDDEKLLNVAFSRSKEKFLVIADVKNLEKKHSISSLLRKFVQHCKDHNYPIISTNNYLPRYEVSYEEEKWLAKISNIDEIIDEIKTSKLFTEKDFYKFFIKDLLDAKKEVIIDSPFITTDRVKDLIPIFDHLLSKNIRIFIFTRIPTEHYSLMKLQSAEEIKNFEDMGITVLPFRGRIHRKLAIVDRKILWEGSLNILSQSRSGEIMRRFVGNETASQMLKFLKWDKNIGEIGENNIQRCEFCNEPGAWYWTDKSAFGGEWTHCLLGNHKIGKEPKSKEEREKIKKENKELRQSKKEKTSEGIPICPRHEIEMVKKKGPYGEFWGCPKYPICRITENIN